MAEVLTSQGKCITTLPENILLEIFTHLSVKDLCTIGRVCRVWRRIIADNTLWRHVDLRPYRLNLQRMWKVMRTHFSDILLSLRMAGYLDPNAANWKRNSLSEAMLKDLQDRCPNMKTLELIKTNMSNVSMDNLPLNLTSLTVTFSMIPPRWFRNISKLKHLETLDLSFSSKTSNTDLRDISTKEDLKILKLDGCYRISEDGLKTIAEKLKGLEVLEISETRCTDMAFHVMCRNMNGLKRLNLSRCKGVTGGGLACIGSGLQELKWLDVSGCANVNDQTLPHLQKLTNLEVLNLDNTQVTQKGIDKLAKALPKCKMVWDQAALSGV